MSRTFPAIQRGLLEQIKPFWPKISRACTQSLGRKDGKFLPDPTKKTVLGCGFWGCVWPTADKRFVLKATLDSTEGPHVSLAIKLFQKHPGLAYYHRVWRLPDRVWTNEFGYTWLYLMLREETDVRSIWKGNQQPNPAYKAVYNALESLPECCGCLLASRRELARGVCNGSDVAKEEKVFYQVLAKASGGPGEYVMDLLRDAYERHDLIFGDVHFANVGLRCHDLSEFGVKRHKKLVVTDLGDFAQNPLVRGSYPEIPVIRSNPELVDEIPVIG